MQPRWKSALGLAALLTTSTAGLAVDQFDGNTADWITAVGGGWQAYAFEQDFPQPPDANGCLSAVGPATITVPGGQITVRRSSDCPIIDGSSSGEFADARITSTESLRLTFDPPIQAFYGYVGSVAPDQTVLLNLLDGDGLSFGTVESRPGPGGADSFGIGFTSKRLVSTIELTTDAISDTALLGTFGGQQAGETPLEGFGASCANTSYPAALCDLAFAYDLKPIREVERDARLWDSLAVAATGYAFEQDFPRPDPPPAALDCLSAPGAVYIPLQNGAGTMTIQRSDGNCPVVAASSAAAADALIAQNQTLTLTFDPPVRAYYSYYGSLNAGDQVTMTLADVNDLQVGQYATRLSTDNVAAMGHGFISPIPIRTVELTSSEAGPTILGAFLGLASEPALEDAGFRCPADASYPAGALCDLAVAYDTQTEQKLTASDSSRSDRFGIAVSLDGDRVLIGADSDGADPSDTGGGAYVFERQADGQWLEDAQLAATDSAASDLFGASVSLSGDRALIGAYNNDDSGSAYVFERQADGQWLQAAKLNAADAAAGDRFGESVFLDGDTAVVGAPKDFDLGIRSGSAYVFERQGNGNWMQIAKLIPAGFNVEGSFGVQVALSGERVLVGTLADSAYLFERQSDGLWTEVATLTASDANGSTDFFGSAVALDGQRALVGAPNHDLDFNNQDTGAAYVYERMPDGQWVETAKLVALDPAPSLQFGESVSLSGNRALISDVAFPDNAAYLFERLANGQWRQLSKVAGDRVARDSARFGRSVSVSADRVLVGAWGDGGRQAGRSTGAAYIFEDLTATDRSLIFADGFEE